MARSVQRIPQGTVSVAADAHYIPPLVLPPLLTCLCSHKKPSHSRVFPQRATRARDRSNHLPRDTNQPTFSCIHRSTLYHDGSFAHVQNDIRAARLGFLRVSWEICKVNMLGIQYCTTRTKIQAWGSLCATSTPRNFPYHLVECLLWELRDTIASHMPRCPILTSGRSIILWA